MDKLIAYLNTLARTEQQAIAQRCGTSVNYLRKAKSKGQVLGDGICAAFERESGGSLTCEDISPTTRWVRIPDPAWPWHPAGKPVVDPLPGGDGDGEAA